MNFSLRIFVFSIIIFFAALPSSIIAKVAENTQGFTLIYSGNLDGELEPCGCSEGGNKGGVKRRVAKIDELRAKNKNLILLSTGGLIVSEMPQDRLKSEYILKGLAANNYDAIGIQWKDLAFGLGFLRSQNLPFVANYENFKNQIEIIRGKKKFVYFHWLNPQTNPNIMGDVSSLFREKKQALIQSMAQYKKKGFVTILGTDLALKTIQKIFPLDNLDILLIKSKYELIGEPQQIANTIVLQPGSRGMRLGELSFELGDNKQIKNWKHEVHALPPEVLDPPRMDAWYEDYNAKVKADYEKRVAQKKALMTGESPYAGDHTCKACHQKEHEIWFGTSHAEAFYKLQDVNKAFDPDCIGCHTLGFEKKGGFIDPALTENLMHVQCENCHGAAQQHVASAGQVKPANSDWQPKKMCAQCHVQQHSPDFVFETYWPKIGHGK